MASTSAPDSPPTIFSQTAAAVFGSLREVDSLDDQDGGAANANTNAKASKASKDATENAVSGGSHGCDLCGTRGATSACRAWPHVVRGQASFRRHRRLARRAEARRAWWAEALAASAAQLEGGKGGSFGGKGVPSEEEAAAVAAAATIAAATAASGSSRRISMFENHVEAWEVKAQSESSDPLIPLLLQHQAAHGPEHEHEAPGVETCTAQSSPSASPRKNSSGIASWQRWRQAKIYPEDGSDSCDSNASSRAAAGREHHQHPAGPS